MNEKLRTRFERLERNLKDDLEMNHSCSPKVNNKDRDGIWVIRPVPILEFVKNYLGLNPPSEAQKQVLHETFGDDPENAFFKVEQVILKIGQSGGKNWLINIAVVYAFYLWCCLSDPHKFFNLEYHETFDVLNFSQVNERQARNVFFKSLTNTMKNVKDPETGENWFTKHMGFQVREFGRGDIKEKELHIPNRHPTRGGIRVSCLDSEAKAVEGYCIWIFIMDEPSRANTPIMFARAKHQYRTAYGNNKGRFPFHQRLGIVFAYPEQEVNDLLVELFDMYSMAPAENKYEVHDNVLTAWYHTWVFNPKDIKTKKAEYRRDYKKDPIDANRRWRAIVPPNIFGFFMPHMGKIQDCANPNLPQPIEYKKTITRRKAKVKGVEKVVDFTALELTKIKRDDKERRWGGDFAVSKDRLVLASGYNEKLSKPVADLIVQERNPETSKEVEKTIKIESYPVVDIILIWEPTKNHPIDFVNVEDIIVKLFQDYFPNSGSLHFDKWNTESIKQKLLDLGKYDCETLQFSNPEQLKYGRVFRHLVWNNACEYPNHPLLLKEMNQLMLLNNAKIDHPNGGSKDIWDAVSICVNLLIQHAHKGGGLDIDMGDRIHVTKRKTGKVEMFIKVFDKFIQSNGRQPHNNEEIVQYIEKEMGIKMSPYEVEYLREHWEAEKNLRESQVLGFSEYYEDFGPSGIFDPNLGLDDDIEFFEDLDII